MGNPVDASENNNESEIDDLDARIEHEKDAIINKLLLLYDLAEKEADKKEVVNNETFEDYTSDHDEINENLEENVTENNNYFNKYHQDPDHVQDHDQIDVQEQVYVQESRVHEIVDEQNDVQTHVQTDVQTYVQDHVQDLTCVQDEIYEQNSNLNLNQGNVQNQVHIQDQIPVQTNDLNQICDHPNQNQRQDQIQDSNLADTKNLKSEQIQIQKVKPNKLESFIDHEKEEENTSLLLGNNTNTKESENKNEIFCQKISMSADMDSDSKHPELEAKTLAAEAVSATTRDSNRMSCKQSAMFLSILAYTSHIRENHLSSLKHISTKISLKKIVDKLFQLKF